MGGRAADGASTRGTVTGKRPSMQPVRVAFGRKVEPTVSLSREAKRTQRQTVRVRAKLLDAFELERHRITAADTISANRARKALRESANTIELRKALDFIADKGQVSSLTLLQMQCAYMEASGWLEAQMATGVDTDDPLAQHEVRQVQKKVQTGPKKHGRKQRGIRCVQHAFVAVLRKHLGHVPLPECLRRWRLYAWTSRTTRIRTEKTIRRTNAITNERATRLATWQSRAKMCPTASSRASADGEVASFGIGNTEGDVDTDLPQPDSPDPPTKFPSSELQLQLIAYRHALPEMQRKLLVPLQRNTRNELLQRYDCHTDDVAGIARMYLEQNGVMMGATGGRLNFAAQVPAVVSAPHPPSVLQAADSGRAKTSCAEISVVFNRPLRSIDEAVVKVDIGERFGHDHTSNAQQQQKIGRRRRLWSQRPSLVHDLGMRFDSHCEELVEILDGSAAAEASRAQPVFRPGVFLTHIQGAAIRSVAVDTAKPSADSEHARLVHVARLLVEALESGEPLLFGFTSQPLHVYRVLHEDVISTAVLSAPQPTSPPSPPGGSRSSSPVRALSKSTSAGTRLPHRLVARPRSANVTLGTRPLGTVCQPKRPASARLACNRSKNCRDYVKTADVLPSQQPPRPGARESATRMWLAREVDGDWEPSTTYSDFWVEGK